MSTSNSVSNNTPIKKALKDYCPTTKAKLIITPQFKEQIDYLHANVAKNTEWSGMLFYTILEGSLQNFEKLVIRPDDIFLMDIGTAAHTAATIQGEDLMKMYETIPDAETKKYGLIHSHHHMETFFSGTDVDELNTNVHNHNFYLSLIVNYASKYCAKIAWIAELKNSLAFSDIDDQPVQQASEEKVIVKVDFNVVFENRDAEVPNYLSDRFLEIEEKKKPKYVTPIYQSGYNYGAGYNNQFSTSPAYGGANQGNFRTGTQQGMYNKGRASQDSLDKAGKEDDDDDFNQFATEGGIDSAFEWEREWYQQHAYKSQRVAPKQTKKEAKKEAEKIKDRQINYLICLWLTKCMDIVRYTPGEEPLLSEFKSIREGLKHYEVTFQLKGTSSSRRTEYNYFLQVAYKKFDEIIKSHASDYSAEEVSNRIASLLREWVTELPIATDFVEIAASYPDFLREMKKLKATP